MTQQEKATLQKEFGKHAKDTGSIELQIARLTHRIKELAGHFNTHAKDFSSKRGLQLLVGQRRRFLDYLASKDEEAYKKLIKRLELRK